MNVTVHLKDDLCRVARHQAVDAGLSLSGWLAKLIEREVAAPKETETTGLLGLLGDAKAAKVPLPLPTLKEKIRGVRFRD